MKRVIAIGVFVNAGLLAGIILKKDVVVHAAGGGGVPVGNGDVNGDGTIDISDAIYLLGNLFTAGPAPIAIECPPGAGGLRNGDVNSDGSIDISDAVYLLSGLFLGGPAPVEINCPPPPTGHQLPTSGLTKCYDKTGNEILCDSADFPGQDAFFQAGCPTQGRFVDNGDGTVSDNCTGLMWQKDTADVSENGTIGDDDRLNWQGALKYCENLGFAGFSDWRLPNVRELQTIVDYGHFDPAIHPVLGALSAWYWSSSGPDHSWSWHIGFYDGSVFLSDKSADIFVRAVRGESVLPTTGQTKCYDAAEAEVDCASIDFPGQDGFYKAGCRSEGRFADNGDGVIDPFDSQRWQDALQYCENLNFAGHDDWRLPNVRELQSIVDYGRGPAIDPVFGVFYGPYWSSTSYEGNPANPWCVWFNSGVVNAGADKFNKPPYVRAVRNAP